MPSSKEIGAPVSVSGTLAFHSLFLTCPAAFGTVVVAEHSTISPSLAAASRKQAFPCVTRRLSLSIAWSHLWSQQLLFF